MTEIHAWLAAQGRARFIAGDDPPDAVRQEIGIVVREHRVALRLGGAAILTAAEVNAALDWKEAQTAYGAPGATGPTTLHVIAGAVNPDHWGLEGRCVCGQGGYRWRAVADGKLVAEWLDRHANCKRKDDDG